MKIVKNVLLLGNAFVLKNDLRSKLEGLSDSLVVGVCASPDMTLEDHVAASASCIDYLDWDVIVLQEDNRVAMDAAWVARSSTPAIETITAMARARNPHTRIVLFEPWTFRDGYSTYSASDMHVVLMHAYLNMVKTDTEVSFVGTAVQAMKDDIKDAMLWSADGRSPKKLMTTIASLVLFQTITGRLPVNLPIVQDVPLWVDKMM